MICEHINFGCSTDTQYIWNIYFVVFVIFSAAYAVIEMIDDTLIRSDFVNNEMQETKFKIIIIISSYTMWYSRVYVCENVYINIM